MEVATGQTGSGRRVLRILKILFIPALVAVGLTSILLGYDWRVMVQDQGLRGHAIYFCFVVLLPLVGFPISAFYVFSGMAFPPLEGLLLTSGGLLVNMAIGYWVGRYFLHKPVSHYLGKTRFNPELIKQRNLTRMTILVRSVPGVPYFMQNYLLALSKVPFWTYLSLSWLIQSLYCAGTIFLTNSGMNFKTPGDALILATIGILFFACIWFSKYKISQSHTSEIDSEHT